MITQTVADDAASERRSEAAPFRSVDPRPRWSASTRIAFRWFVVYFGLYVVSTQMLNGLILLPVGEFPDLGSVPPVKTLVFWVAKHVFHIDRALVVGGSGSGDKTFDWVHAFTLLVIASVAASIWSAVDRRAAHPRLYAWFRLFLRFALGSTMITYGAVKMIPLQMPAPPLTRLLEPFGNFSPMGVLWYSIGASRAYEILIGCAELVGGTLLFIPRTTTLGALICLGDTVEIFALNMTYDVPVKLFSFHLILMSIFLLAPNLSRLANVLVLNRAATPCAEPPLGRGRRGSRVALVLQVVAGVYLLGMNINGARRQWTQFGGGAPKPALYGVWNIEEMSIDGHTRSPLLTDYDRWRRVVFQSQANVFFQRMDDSMVGYTVAYDLPKQTLTLGKASDKNWKGTLSYNRPDAEQLILAGDMDGHPIRIRARLFDREKFLLVSRGFHWVQEYPFNR